MKAKEIQQGRVYTNTTSEHRRVLSIYEDANGTKIVRYQPMPWKMAPADYLKHFAQLAPLPQQKELLARERVAPGVLYAERSLEAFAHWAKQEREPHTKFCAPDRTMASQVIEAVMRKQYTSLAAERAFTAICSTRECYITLGPCSMPWIYTMPDGSRIAFMAPVLMAEVDDMGRPMLDSPNHLDWNQAYAFGDMKKIVAAEQRLWIEANHPYL